MILRDNPVGIGLVRDELTGWVRSFDRTDRAQDRAFYLEAWNGNGLAFQYDRIERGNILIPNPCVSVLGGMQPGPLRALVRSAARDGRGDDGLLQRFQLLVWPDAADWRNVDRWPDTAAKTRAYAVYSALDTTSPTALGAQPDDVDSPPYLRFSPAAQEVFDEWRNRLEGSLRDPELSPLLESHLAKYRSLLPSLSLLFHLSAVVSGTAPGLVDAESIRMAVAWCDLLEAHARRVYASATEADIDAALALAERIKACALPSPFTYRDEYHNGWSALDTPDATRRAVAVLADHGWVRESIMPTAGRDREDIHIHPSLPRKLSQNSGVPPGAPLTVTTEGASVGSVGTPPPRPRDSCEAAALAREVIEL